MIISLLRAILAPPSKPSLAESNVEGAITIHPPGGGGITYTPSDNAEAPADFGAGAMVGALVFGATLGPAILTGVAAGAVVYIVQGLARAGTAAPGLPPKQ